VSQWRDAAVVFLRRLETNRPPRADQSAGSSHIDGTVRDFAALQMAAICSLASTGNNKENFG
jgi:hypothetical protein